MNRIQSWKYIIRVALCVWLLNQAALLHAQSPEISRLKAVLPQVKDSTQYVDLLNRLSVLYLPFNLDTCFTYINAAHGIAERLHYARGKAGVQANFGNYYVLRANSYLSYRFYLDALQAYEVLNDSAAICQVLSNIAIYHRFEGRQASAAHYTARAMRIARRLPGDSLYGGVLANYYFVYMSDSTHADSAHWALEKAWHIAEHHHDTRLLLRLRTYAAEQLFREKDHTTAQQQMQQIIRDADSSGYTYLALYASRQMANFRHQLKQADSSRYKAAMVKYGIAGGYWELLLPTAAELYAVYTQQGRPMEAARYSSLMLSILEKEHDNKSQGELDYMDYFMQDRRLSALQLQHHSQQQQLDTKRLENRKRRYLIGGLIVSVLGIGVLLAFFYYSYKRSRGNAARLAEKYREISEKNTLLRAHDDFKNKLISLIAHDFRLPLVHIREITSLLKDESLGVDEAAALLTKVERSSRDTLYTFDSILRWISSQLSGFVYTPEQLPLKELVTAALQSLADVISERKLRVSVDIPADLQVLAEREMLQFVHRNFIHNAAKFSPSGGSLEIRATQQEGMVTLSLADEGPGIPEDILPQLFAYRSTESSGRAKQQGAGLALIICKDFMEMMNGSVAAANRSGKGAVLSYTLPVAGNEAIKNTDINY